jgi:RecB family exonuclease
MSDYFLESIARYYFQNYKTDLSSICFVFPSRRAGIFFQNHLQKLATAPVWSPDIRTINELVESTSKSLTGDSITLIFKLHKVYNQVMGSAVPFEEFHAWGDMLLNDFNDIDKHLVSPHQLYLNLAQLKEIEDDYSHLSEAQQQAIFDFWGTFLNDNRNSIHQEQFLKVWDKLEQVYTCFNEELDANNMVYSGRQYRRLAESIANGSEVNFQYEKIVFAGFNALTPTEEVLFKYLQKKNQADFFWDPVFGIDNHQTKMDHGPTYFLEKNRQLFPAPKNWNVPQPAALPDITVTPIATSLDQLSEVHQFFSTTDSEAHKSALVLADENLLLPALHALPDNIKQINVTMGYPIKGTPAFGLIELLYQLQIQTKSSPKSKTWFYHKQVVPLLQHPYVSMLSPEATKKHLKQILATNRLYLSAGDFTNDTTLALVFQKIHDSKDIHSYILQILTHILQHLESDSDKLIEKECLFQLHKSTIRLTDLLSTIDQQISPSTWFKLFKSLSESLTVPFKGEPLAGLQVMGILETRAIDFDKLVILDLNEGVFPKATPPNSYIPYALRIGFGLPTIEHQDSIFSYYFFRLIQRAKKVHLLYTTSTQGGKTGEMSRFIYQLKYLSEYQTNTQLYFDSIKLLTTPPLVTQKTRTIQQHLANYLENGDRYLSPSALSMYIECPMRFYFQKVIKIKEPDELIEEADSRVFGLLFHDAVENLYKPYMDQTIRAETIQTILKHLSTIDNTIHKAFQKHFISLDAQVFNDRELQGKNRLVFEVIKQYIKRFLNNELNRCPFTLVDLEKNVEYTHRIRDGHAVKLGGIIDRIDEKDHMVHIIDYKTGSGESSFKNISDLFNPELHSKTKAIFQTLLYSYIMYQKNGQQSFIPGIIWVKNTFKSGYSTLITQKTGKETTILTLHQHLEEFVQYLNSLLDDIFNPSIAFTQTSNLRKCEYCPYRKLCSR